MTDDPQAKGLVRLDEIGERLRPRSDAHDEHEPRVTSALAKRGKDQAKREPLGPCAHREDREGDEQDGAADVRQLEEEEEAQHAGGKGERGAQDVDDLGPDPQACPGSIEALAPEREQPAERVDGERAGGVVEAGKERLERSLASEPDGRRPRQGCAIAAAASRTARRSRKAVACRLIMRCQFLESNEDRPRVPRPAAGHSTVSASILGCYGPLPPSRSKILC